MFKKGLLFLIIGLVLTTHVWAQSSAILPSRQALPASFPSTNTPPPRSPSTRKLIYKYARSGDVQSLKNLNYAGHSLDELDAKGNSPLCEAVWRQDKTAVSALVQAGANTQHTCLQKIPETYQKAVGLSGSTTGAATGLSTGAVVGIGVGAAALIGGGVALAAGGGGSGGGHKDACENVVCDGANQHCNNGQCVCDTGFTMFDGVCYQTLSCVNGTQNADMCVCQPGYAGQLCETCATGYINQGGVCYAELTCSANQHQEANACVCDAGFGFFGTNECHAALACKDGTQQGAVCVCNGHASGDLCDTCEAGYGFHGTNVCYADLACVNGSQTGGACVCATEGWTGTLCDTPASCDGYEYSSCPVGYAPSATCLSGNTTKLQCNNCAEGYGKYGTNECHATISCGTNQHQQGDTCVCDTGYEMVGGVCTFTSCPANQYKVGSECLSCPENSTSPVGSTSINQCTCNSGYVMSAAGICVVVQANIAGNGYVYIHDNDTRYKIYNNSSDFNETNPADNYPELFDIFSIYNDGTFINNASIRIDENSLSDTIYSIFYIDNGLLTNNGSILINSNGSELIFTDIGESGTFENTGTIEINSTKDEATISLISSLDPSEEKLNFKNSGNIYVTGNAKSIGGLLNGAQLISKKDVLFSNKGEIKYTDQSVRDHGPLWTYGIAAPDITINNEGKIDGMFLITNLCDDIGCFQPINYVPSGTNLTFTNSGTMENGEGQDWALQYKEASVFATVSSGSFHNTSSGIINGHIYITGKEINGTYEVTNDGQINAGLYLSGKNISLDNYGIINAPFVLENAHNNGTTLTLDGSNITAKNFGTIKSYYAERDISAFLKITNGALLTNEENGYIRGSIEVENATFINNGNIYSDADAITAKDAFVTNNGTITISSEKNYGIIANNSTINNSGTIIIEGFGSATGDEIYDYCDKHTCYEDNNGKFYKDESLTEEVIKTNYIELVDNSILLTSGTLSSEGTMDLASFSSDGTGSVSLLSGGNLQAEAITGDLHLDTSNVSNGFQTTYTNTNAILANDTTGLNLISDSHLFNASLAENGKDVLMTMKSFDDVTSNKSLAAFLAKNYAEQNNEAFFNELKSIGSAGAFTSALNHLTAGETLSRFTHEDLTAWRDVNANMNALMFANMDQPLFQNAGSFNAFSFQNDSSSSAQFALAHKRISPYAKIGYAMSTTHLSSDDHRSTTRRNDIFQAFTPIAYDRFGWQLISTPQIGFARAHYSRKGYNGTSYDGVIEKRIAGFMNEARYPVQIGSVTFAPTVELNALVSHQKGNETRKAYSLTMPADTLLSVEAGAGFHLDTQIKGFSLTAGTMLYREFADPYNMKVGMNGMDGSFDLFDEQKKYRAAADFGFGYDAGPLHWYGSLRHFVDTNNRTQMNTGINVHF